MEQYLDFSRNLQTAIVITIISSMILKSKNLQKEDRLQFRDMRLQKMKRIWFYGKKTN